MGNLAFDSIEALVERAIAWAGIIQVRDYLAGKPRSRGRLEPLLAEYKAEGKPITVVYPQKRHLSAKVQVFVAFMKALMVDLRSQNMVS